MISFVITIRNRGNWNYVHIHDVNIFKKLKTYPRMMEQFYLRIRVQLEKIWKNYLIEDPRNIKSEIL